MDPDGEFDALGAIIGAVSEGLTEAVSQLANGGITDLGAIGEAALEGAILGAVVPSAAAGSIGRLLNTANKAAKAGGVAKGAEKAPDFIVSKGGTAFPVPKGSKGSTSVVNPQGKTTGSAFTGGKGGANGQVDTMRIMDATPARGKSPGYPNGYIKYENKAGQGVDPNTGRTLSNKDSHFPLD